MRFAHKVFLLIALAALPPVVMSGWVSVEISSGEIQERVMTSERRTATQAAEMVERLLVRAAEDLGRTSQYIPFEHFPPEELPQALRIPYEQLGWATAVALFDEDGRPLVPPARRGPTDATPPDREPVGDADLALFSERLPLRTALAHGQAIGAPYLATSGAPRIALARALPVSVGHRRWVLAVEASLADAKDLVARQASGQSGIAFLVDHEGTLLTHPRSDWVRARQRAAGLPIVRRGLEASSVETGRYASLGDREVVGSFAPVPSMRGGLVLEQDVEEAFVAIGRLRTAAFLWTLLALCLTVLGALFLTRGVTAPVAQMAKAVEAIERGDYDHRLSVRSRDELGMLASTFNDMAAEVRAKQEEITAWNRELAARVEERTRELRDARDQVVRSEKLAATAELASGVAHELNNPLTGILGLGEVLLEGCTNGVREDLEEIVRQARRMRTTIRNLTRFALAENSGNHQAINLNRLVDEAIQMNRERMERDRIEATAECAPDLLEIEGNSADLLLAVLHVIRNAMQAMPGGGKLTLRTAVVDHSAVKLVITDTGKGIQPDRLQRIFEPFYTDKAVGTDRAGGGLGLPVAHRIIEEHKGRIAVTSQPGKGTSFTFFFPGVRRSLHLR